MGWRYIAFRVGFAAREKIGLLKKAFPTNPAYRQFITLEDWKKQDAKFFFNSKEDLDFPKHPTEVLAQKALDIHEGNFTFFSATKYCLGKDYDWVTNPDSRHKYNINQHWTAINDYSQEAGDVKFVWEKSRFSYLYTLIRYDYQFGKDQSAFVFSEIMDWINKNPINQGPNYKCSQEISLRVLNWTFALYYYKHSPALTHDVFDKIMHCIYWQVKHVYANINFSRIAVRNNHAITETLTLYLAGLLFPFFPEAGVWKRKGKQWFEQEVGYQLYADGTFLQFSMNYHRVVIQLLTWAFGLAKRNNESFAPVVAERAKASLNFLLDCMNEKNGHLPNYGANDGALFFPLNDHEYRDYRPQLYSLAAVLSQPGDGTGYEDQRWYGIELKEIAAGSRENGMKEYPVGGFYLLREEDAFTFTRCGNHNDRPSQADNLHLDIWVKGVNVLRDGGSYKYNATDKEIRYFFGTKSQNTVMLGDNDQMLKGGRFIWYYWTQAVDAGWKEEKDYYVFKGKIKAFQHVDRQATHTRSIRKYKGKLKWEVTDEVHHKTGLLMHQLWHPNNTEFKIVLTAVDANGKALPATERKGWYSPKYGKKEECPEIVFTTDGKIIRTIIEITA